MTKPNSVVPTWITEELFQQVLQQTVGDFEKILSLKAFSALAPGENYATVMLRVQIELLMSDKSLRQQSFMLKVAHDSQFYRDQMIKFKMFHKEAGMYKEVVPELEQMYREKGLHIKFGAKAYSLPLSEDIEHILVEDLAPKGFRNVKRHDGLDWQHTMSCLKKLAQWHAASAVRVEQKGQYDELYLHGFVCDDGREMSEQMYKGNRDFIMRAARKLSNHEMYYEKLETMLYDITNVMYSQSELDAEDFNVLNHGDFWCNNIMFQYDAEGKLLETYFVDFQMPRYGSPAQDLWYFLLSSTKLDFKIERFDEMVRIYYEHLIEHLKILQYSKALPSLKDLHKKLLKMGSWALMTITCIMAGVLCEPTEMANIDNFVEGSDDGDKFRELLYFNERFLKHFEVIMPFLLNRGALDL